MPLLCIIKKYSNQMKKIVLFTIIALASFNVNAANKTKVEAEVKPETAVVENVMMIDGLVMDNSTNETLAGAVVTVDGETIYTDLDGNFILKNVKPGKIKLKVSMISYADQTIEIDSKEVSKLKIKLKHI